MAFRDRPCDLPQVFGATFFDVTVIVWCEAIARGCTFAARITDGANARWYTGQGATAIEAVSWALDDYARRGVLEREPTLARNTSALPGDGLAVSSSRPRRITPAPIATGPTLAATADGQCFEQQIPRSPAPRLFHETPTPAPVKRRSRGARR